MNKNIVLLLLSLFIASSCIEETEIVLQGDMEERLVVDVRMTTDTTNHQAILTKTAEYYRDNQTPRVTGAEVKVTSASGNVIVFEEIDPGVYQTEEVYGKIGEDYFLTIEYNGELHESQSEIRRTAIFDSIGFRYEPFMESYRVLFYGHDPPGRGDHYAWYIYKNGVLMTDSLHNLIFSNDDFFDGQYLFGFDIDPWFNSFDLQAGDTVMVEMHNITKETFEFYYEVFLESGGSGPAVSSGKTPVGNISNDSFGLFYTASIIRRSGIIPGR